MYTEGTCVLEWKYARGLEFSTIIRTILFLFNFSLVVGTVEADNGVGSVDIHTIVKYIQTKIIHRQTSVNTELYRIDRITCSVKILSDPAASQIARHKLHNQMK